MLIPITVILDGLENMRILIAKPLPTPVSKLCRLQPVINAHFMSVRGISRIRRMDQHCKYTVYGTNLHDVKCEYMQSVSTACGIP